MLKYPEISEWWISNPEGLRGCFERRTLELVAILSAELWCTDFLASGVILFASLTAQKRLGDTSKIERSELGGLGACPHEKKRKYVGT